ncbi:MAG: VOC family protein [Solirubrobacteraceae bacterium]
MGKRTSYTPGTFSWADLATTDQPAAKQFYGELFGWEAEDMPVGDGVFYAMMRIEGKSVAAIAPQPEQQSQAGVPPMWQSYITVESANASAEKAGQLGAQVHAPPFDVMDVGRMAVIRDPQGAFFMAWEPKMHIGAELVNGPGQLSWNELASPDVEGSTTFYSELFGWKIEKLADSSMPYWTIQNAAGHANGGIRNPQPGEPPSWSVYFGYDDVAAGIAKVEQLGGSKLMGPMPIGPGTIATVRDPQGAVFTLYAGEFED